VRLVYSAAMRALLLLATLAVWGLALAYYGDLPDRIPMHFGLNGEADRFADKSIVAWFWMPSLATLFAFVFGRMLPGWMRSMAHSNSQLLNMPDRARFRALSADARVRVVDATLSPLCMLAVVLQLLFSWIVYASAQVALGIWRTLPIWPTLAFVGAIIACAILLLLVSTRAVARETEGRDLV
jgi:uncharacterized membrane protein